MSRLVFESFVATLFIIVISVSLFIWGIEIAAFSGMFSVLVATPWVLIYYKHFRE